MTKWIEGARAVIEVTEHPRNYQRVVILTERHRDSTGEGWVVRAADGGTFDGHAAYVGTTISAGHMLVSDVLAIAQWKLRLLESEQ
jgi:hypothetical protein